MPKVLLLYNEPRLASNHPDAESERDLLHTVEAVQKALLQFRHEVQRCGLRYSPEELLQALNRYQPDVVFNLFEGFGHNPASEYHVAGLLDWLGIPYTGCPLEAMVLGRDKVRTKFLMRGQGIPTADFQVVYSKDDIKPVASWPLFVKPAATDASLGIDQKSVVTSKDTLQAKVAELNDRYGVPVILETYLPGTEFNVGVVEIPQRTCLPIAEMVYTPQQGVSWPIVSYASKWVTGSPEDLAMQPRCPAQISEELSAQLQEIALKAFTLAGCQDVARVDIRLDEQGQPQVLEVNPNPDLGPQAGLARMLKVYGLAYDAFINQLVTNHL